ncbi:hypothetical protein JXO59_05200 [candidate division KSB1 bacterium]|nr:hypothetical protein [candidate division KSB1 bacterium]
MTSADYVAWYNAYFAGGTTYDGADFNLDGQVTSVDYDLLWENALNGAAASVP